MPHAINEPFLKHRFRALWTAVVNVSWRAAGCGAPTEESGGSAPPRPLLPAACWGGRVSSGPRKGPAVRRCRGGPAAAPSSGQGLGSPSRHWVRVTGGYLSTRPRGRPQPGLLPLPWTFRSSVRKLRLSRVPSELAAATFAIRERDVFPPTACSAGWVFHFPGIALSF